jgi:hypothetical protein
LKAEGLGNAFAPRAREHGRGKAQGDEPDTLDQGYRQPRARRKKAACNTAYLADVLRAAAPCVQKSSGRIGTGLPAGDAGAFAGLTSKQSASASGDSSELSWERTGVTTGRPSGPAAVVARM